MKHGIILGIALALGASPTLAATAFQVTLLDSDHSAKAKHIDPNLVDAWGLCQGPGGDPVWVSDNGTGLSTVYAQGSGNVEAIVVTIPGGNPTGCAYNPTSGFQVTEGSKSGAALFLFDSEPGIISGWSSTVDASNAIVAYDGSGHGSSYKGLALDASNSLLFAADFTNDRIEVFNSSFTMTNSFTDKSLKHYGPFNVALLNGNLYVAFARQGKGINEKDGPGLGAVDVFSESGTLIQQLVATGGALNAPWGMTIAPSNFNEFAGALLVGNFGNGWVNAYDLSTGASLGTLNDKKGNPIEIPGLWALDPVPSNDITYSAGPNREKHGALGLITVAN